MSGCDFSYLQSLLLGEDDLNNVDTVCWGDFDLDRYQLPHTEDVDFDDSFLENIFGFSNSDNKNAETIEYNDDKEIYMTESIEDNYISLECSEKMLFDDVCDEIELNDVEPMSDHSKYDNLIEIVNENSRTSTEDDEELKKEKSRKAGWPLVLDVLEVLEMFWNLILSWKSSKWANVLEIRDFKKYFVLEIPV